jgi:hypothetical protein
VPEPEPLPFVKTSSMLASVLILSDLSLAVHEETGENSKGRKRKRTLATDYWNKLLEAVLPFKVRLHVIGGTILTEFCEMMKDVSGEAQDPPAEDLESAEQGTCIWRAHEPNGSIRVYVERQRLLFHGDRKGGQLYRAKPPPEGTLLCPTQRDFVSSTVDC